MVFQDSSSECRYVSVDADDMSLFGCEQGKMYDALSSPDAKVFDQGHLYLVRMLQTFHPRTPFFCVPKWQHGGQNCMVGIPNIHEMKRTEMRRPYDVPTPVLQQASHKPIVFAKPLAESRLVSHSN